MLKVRVWLAYLACMHNLQLIHNLGIHDLSPLGS